MPGDGAPHQQGSSVRVAPTRVLDAVGQAVIITDPSGSITLWDLAAEGIFGWSATEVVGRDLRQLVTPGATADQTTQSTGRALAGDLRDSEIEARRRDGSGFTALVTATPVLDDDGTVAAFIYVWRETASVHPAPGPTELNREQLQRLFQDSSDLFAIADADGVIAFVAGPTRAIFGVVPDALIGVSTFDLLQPSNRPRAEALWARQRSEEERTPAEDYWVRHVDDTWRCLNVLIDNRLDDPAVGGMVVAARDVTHLRHLERERLVIAGANAALIRATSEGDLFDEICKVVVDDATYHLAWVGLADPTLPLGVRMVALGGESSPFFETLGRLASDDRYRGPIVDALETGAIRVVQDLAALPESASWQQPALDHGYRSVIALPLPFVEGGAGVLAIYAEDPDAFTGQAVAVLTELAADLTYGVDALRTRAERTSYRGRFEAGLEAVVRAIATAAELRDPYTAGHQRRVAELATAIAADMGVDPDLTAGIGTAASIHDVGKLAIPAEILSRPGRLTHTEFALVKEHAQAGHDIVQGIEFPWPVAEMILQHHERLDGSGYPRGLRGREISLGARIIAVADVVEAMCSHRPYRPGLGIASALLEVNAGRATLFDADVADACTRLFGERGFAFTI